jgi:hypothetical protein
MNRRQVTPNGPPKPGSDLLVPTWALPEPLRVRGKPTDVQPRLRGFVMVRFFRTSTPPSCNTIGEGNRDFLPPPSDIDEPRPLRLEHEHNRPGYSIEWM